MIRKRIRLDGKGHPVRNVDWAYLERRDGELWRLAVLVMLALNCSIVISHLYELGGSPRALFQGVWINGYITGSAVLIVFFCLYLLWKNRQLRRLRRQLFAEQAQVIRLSDSLEEVTSFYEVSSSITAKKDLPMILELIVRESLRCLKAQRSTVFILDGPGGVLNQQITYAPNPLHNAVDLIAEKKVARKVLKQGQPLLLRGADDLSEFNDHGAEMEVRSLLSIPLLPNSGGIGVLSIARIGQERHFSPEDLKLLTIFGNHAAIAIENSHLLQAKRTPAPQNGTRPETVRLDFKEASERACRGPGALRDASLGGAPDGMRHREAPSFQIDMAAGHSAQEIHLTQEGAFIRTPEPLDLGERFTLKLLLPNRESLDLGCKVIWTNRYGVETRDLPHGMSVKFLDLQPEWRCRIESILRQSSPNSPVLN